MADYGAGVSEEWVREWKSRLARLIDTKQLIQSEGSLREKNMYMQLLSHYGDKYESRAKPNWKDYESHTEQWLRLYSGGMQRRERWRGVNAIHEV